MIINKISTGFVVQQFDTETRRFVSQEFIGGDDPTWEDQQGNTLWEPDFSDMSDEEDLAMIFGPGGVDHPTLAFEMKQPSEIGGIDRFKKGDKVLATPDLTDDAWSEFQGTVKGFRRGDLVTVEDQDGECFDCYPDQLELLEEKDRTKD